MGPQTPDHRKSFPDWTDELRQALKYIVSCLLASTPLYQRCSLPEEWEATHEEMPLAAPVQEDPMDSDSPDTIEDEAGEDDDEDDADADAVGGRSQKYSDGLINRPLNPEQTQMLISIYKEIGMILLEVSRYLQASREDDMQAFIEVSTVQRALDMVNGRQYIPGFILWEWRA